MSNGLTFVNFSLTKKPPTTAEAIRKAREKAGLSQEAAARDLGVSSQTVYRWESGAPVKDRDLAAMARLYKADFAALYKMVPRSTLRVSENDLTLDSDAASEPRFPFAQVLRTPAVRARLAAFRAELIEMGASEDGEERMMSALRDRQRIAEFVGGRENDLYSEREVIQVIDNYARIARDIGTALGMP